MSKDPHKITVTISPLWICIMIGVASAAWGWKGAALVVLGIPFYIFVLMPLFYIFARKYK